MILPFVGFTFVALWPNLPFLVTYLGTSHDVQDSQDVDLTVLDRGVAVDAGDGEDVHLAPLVGVEGEDERHGIVDTGVGVDN